ncbi:hypothetical protein A1O1_01546 [Capronia coronata CBS 617.96]|uniref:HCNGP-like protein n=1 Tax=Capronia coronata CBS 617.96 TaxID=1182541 RepID=W9Z399_9EURO|nr:uncharacterized protein A1O1_01546 [Capronia coronata CBS 617.96]EXJ96420.1 hypothetical protein A1O1_01546 [Capronia coronata CBS 617.96]
MSALVGYESSDEEDEPVTAQDHPLADTGRATSFNKTTLNGQENHSVHETTQKSPAPGKPTFESSQSIDGPIVGPTMPEQVGDDIDGESTLQVQQTMSERDAIRFLTQTLNPMTSMPPSPPGSPNQATNARFKRFLDLKAQGVHFNDDLSRKSSFRNPSFLSTMMGRVGLGDTDQYRTSLPRELWDPLSFPPSAYKEELLRSQQTLKEQELASKKSLAASGKRTIEFTSAGSSRANSRDSTPGVPNKRKRP